jgi:hypothetical protein
MLVCGIPSMYWISSTLLFQLIQRRVSMAKGASKTKKVIKTVLMSRTFLARLSQNTTPLKETHPYTQRLADFGRPVLPSHLV